MLSVCRRVLGHNHDAEDVFQATFLVLATKARVIRKETSIGSWLFGVAHRLALQAKSGGRGGNATSVKEAALRAPATQEQVDWREDLQVLDEELQQKAGIAPGPAAPVLPPGGWTQVEDCPPPRVEPWYVSTTVGARARGPSHPASESRPDAVHRSQHRAPDSRNFSLANRAGRVTGSCRPAAPVGPS